MASDGCNSIWLILKVYLNRLRNKMRFLRNVGEIVSLLEEEEEEEEAVESCLKGLERARRKNCVQRRHGLTRQP